MTDGVRGIPIRRRRELGYAAAYSKADGSVYTLPRREYPRLLADWMAGKAFWTGESFYGSVITLKLGDIIAVADVTPEELAMQRADQRADEDEDREQDMFSGHV